MKKVSAICCLLAAVLLVACDRKNLEPAGDAFVPDQKDLTAFTLKSMPVLRDGMADGNILIRFYEDLPHIPYVSAADFQALMLPGSSLGVTWSGNDGVFQLENKYATATVDTRNEVFSSDKYMDFTNLMEQVQPGMANAYYDAYPFVRFASQEATAPAPVKLDYGPYGIDFRADEGAVYLPLTTLADIYSDVYFHYAHISQETVIVNSRDDVGSDKVSLSDTRAADVIDFAYAELCFAVDHFYGHPGRLPYEQELIQLGLDKLLESSTGGKQLKQLLHSEKMIDYAAGLEYLLTFLYDGGHTNTWTDTTLILIGAVDYSSVCPDLHQMFMEYYIYPYYQKLARLQLTSGTRLGIFQDNAIYHKKGDTAICHLDAFGHTDAAAWNAFYNGTGPRPTHETSPEDHYALFLDALKMADEDPEVKNLVIDLTYNTGGSSDVVVAMTSLMYNESHFQCQNVLTGQNLTWNFDVDRNLDGKYDEKDKDVHYDLNFTVLTSKISFSCGNLFPALCKDAGVLVAGEQCGGGSCAVGVYRTPEGFQYRLSSARARLCTKNWENIDAGVVPQVLLEYGPDYPFEFNGATFVFQTLPKFYNLDYLSSVTNEFYK